MSTKSFYGIPLLDYIFIKVRINNLDKKYTLRDIAKLANVSFKTVSRVINNEPRVRKRNGGKSNESP